MIAAASRRILESTLPVLLLVAAAPAAADEALWEKVRSAPNVVLILRHGAVVAQRGQTGAAFDESGQCRNELMLSEQGREWARRVGRVFRERGIEPHVVSSAMCRNRDTAMLAFGKAELDPALRESATGDGQRYQAFLAASTGWILKHRGPRPLVMVMHLPNIDGLTGEQPAQDELLVTTSTERGELDVAGRIRLPPP